MPGPRPSGSRSPLCNRSVIAVSAVSSPAMAKRVLIIEDEPDVARLVEFHLRGAGFEVERAGTAAEGLAALRAAPPDVVVLDLMLPDQSGYEVCKTLRAE